MVRSYLRHEPTQAFGIIASSTCTSSIYDPSSSSGDLAYVGGWEDVLVWDIKKGNLASMWHSTGVTSPVTTLSRAPTKHERRKREQRRRLLLASEISSQEASSSSQILDALQDDELEESEDLEPLMFAVGHQDGSLRLWAFDPSYAEGFNAADSSTYDDNGANERATFNGHAKAVSAVTWNEDGTRLISGGMEGNLVVWDAVDEVGLFRLRGHKAPITSIHFIGHPLDANHPGYVLSTSKDTFMKLWDLSTQHCIQTVVVGRGEVLSSTIREGIELRTWTIITGSGDGEVKAWRMDKSKLEEGLKEDENGMLSTPITLVGSVPLPSMGTSGLTHAVSILAFHPNPDIPIIYLQTADKSIMLLRLRSNEELEAKQARRRRREREKAKQSGHEPEEKADESTGTWLERVTDWCFIRAGGKIRSAALVDDTGAGNTLQVLLSLSNNSLETFNIPCPPRSNAAVGGKSARAMKAASATGQIEATRTHVLDLPGHRTDIRCLAVSADDQILASASNGSLKIWNLRTTACIRTMNCGYALCSLFLPGDRHVVIGTKSGELELFDIASSTMIESIKAHDGPIWSIDLRADKGGIVSGSADKDVKFWDIRHKEVAGPGSTIITRLGEERVIKAKQTSLVHVKTLKMTDDVLAVRYSPDGRLLAVSLLDSTVKVFFQDTLKFFLSLYGHKLPVLAMDISSDSKLIVTCSADKNVKIWGLDFGDCHKSIFAHDESIMQIAFERNSHYFWSVSKDRMVKYWDGDKFEMIQKLEGHHGEVWALAVSSYGEFVVTGSHDKSIRVWEKTEDPLFLEEEREREMEQMHESQTAAALNREDGRVGGEEGEDDGNEVEAVQKHTAETLMAGEKIMEAIELADADRQQMREYEESRAKAGPELAAALQPPKRSALLIAMGSPSPEDYVLGVLEKVPAAQMEDALLVLPFKQVMSLMEYLGIWANVDKNISLVSRILFFMLRTHRHQIVSNRVMRTTLLNIRANLRSALQRQKSTLGYNKAALRYLRRQHDATKTASMLEEDLLDETKVKARIEEAQKKRKKVVY